MKKIDQYIHEVTYRLPSKTQADVALELKSSIMDMLPEDYTEEEEKEVLAEFGDPAKMARQYREHPSTLFGQQVYDFFISSLKAGGFVFLVMALVIAVTGIMAAYTDESGLFALITTISWDLIGAIFNLAAHVFFWGMLVLVFLEWIGVNRDENSSALTGKPWKPEDLGHNITAPVNKSISKSAIYFRLFWTFALTILFITAANGIGPDGIPVFKEDVLRSFLPFVVLLVAAKLAVIVYKWRQRHWNRTLAIVNASFHFLFLVFLILFASRSSLFNPAFMTYLSERFDISISSIQVYPYVMLWVIVLSIISSVVYDSIVAFKKAKILHY
ncbi:hypothetical protein SAMN04487936_111117 [Halobacillus dabanensis]|uniref:Uncharacterized protein n=1 Tax=Halobacillus dabanensis TaxID=240302 RepID=A0A1I3YRI4_HALDA|nr:hypothetical protein [Halobacillus dabanensis]SFK33836.1 hypothetical protein SAMN04487936_111117 [Halobacillus dabanensis]